MLHTVPPPSLFSSFILFLGLDDKYAFDGQGATNAANHVTSYEFGGYVTIVLYDREVTATSLTHPGHTQLVPLKYRGLESGQAFRFDQCNMPYTWAPFGSLVWAAWGTGLSFYAFASPREAAALFGIDLRSDVAVSPSSTDALALQFVRIWAGRNLIIGLAIFAFQFKRMFKAAGILWLCCLAGGVTDIVVTSQWGMNGKAWVHAFGATVMGLVGWGLLKGG